MKITKITTCVFFLAVFIGYVSVPRPKQVLSETFVDNPKPLPLQQVETKDASGAIEEVDNRTNLEIIEEIDNWIDEDKYPHRIKLLETGDGFHGDEVKAKSGETWLGLFSKNGKSVLRSTKIKIRRVYDDIADYPNKRKKTGKSVSVHDAERPLFLLKNAETLTQGEVSTLFRGITWREISEDENLEGAPDEYLTGLVKGFAQKYKIGGKEFKLSVIEAKNENHERILALISEHKGNRQILHTMNIAHNSDLGTLYWVGDLDRDGKPDFYADLFVHYNVGNKTLFLSSKAGKGKIAKKAAYFWTTGC
jgi:hypothetical protein